MKSMRQNLEEMHHQKEITNLKTGFALRQLKSATPNTQPSTQEDIDFWLDQVSKYNKMYGRGRGDLEDHCYTCGISPSGLKEAIKAQRQSDLKKISFHAGIDLKTLQGYLESKVSK